MHHFVPLKISQWKFKIHAKTNDDESNNDINVNNNNGDIDIDIDIEINGRIDKYTNVKNKQDFFFKVDNIDDVTPGSIYDRYLFINDPTNISDSKWMEFAHHNFESLLDCFYTPAVLERKDKIEFELENINFASHPNSSNSNSNSKIENDRVIICPKKIDMNQQISNSDFEQKIQLSIKPPWIAPELWYFAYYLLIEETYTFNDETFNDEEKKVFCHQRKNFYFAENQRILLENAPMCLKFGNKTSVQLKYNIKFFYSVLFLIAVLYAFGEIVYYLDRNLNKNSNKYEYSGWDDYNCFVLIVIFSPNFKRALVSTLLGELFTVGWSVRALNKEKAKGIFPLLQVGIYLLIIILALIIPVLFTHMIPILIIFGIAILIGIIVALAIIFCVFCLFWCCFYCFSVICCESRYAYDQQDPKGKDDKTFNANAIQVSQLVQAIDNELDHVKTTEASKVRLKKMYVDTSKINVVNDYFGIKMFKQFLENNTDNNDNDNKDEEKDNDTERNNKKQAGSIPYMLKRSQSTRFDDLFAHQVASRDDTADDDKILVFILIVLYLVVLIMLPAYIRWIYGNDFWDSVEVTLTERRTSEYFEHYFGRFQLYTSFFTWFF